MNITTHVFAHRLCILLRMLLVDVIWR